MTSGAGRPILETTDPAALDAQLSSLAAGLAPPPAVPGEVVLVVGPWLAGVSTLTAALRERMPERRFLEAAELAPGIAPVAVIFAVSAVAPLAESDCALLDDAARCTDLVIGVLTKIDVHRDWRAVLAADAELVGSRTARLRDMPWVGVAAGPAGAAAQLGDLVAVLRQAARRGHAEVIEIGCGRGKPISSSRSARLPRRPSTTRRWRYTADVTTCSVRRGCRVPSAASHCAAESSRPGCSWATSPATAAHRCAPNCPRTSPNGVACCRGTAAGCGPRPSGTSVYGRAAEVVEEVDTGISEHLRDIAAELGLVAAAVPPPASLPDLGAPGSDRRGGWRPS